MGENLTLNVDGMPYTITVDDPKMPLLYACAMNLASTIRVSAAVWANAAPVRCIYRQLADTCIALIAEVRMHRDSGVIEIARLVCAHDCGVIVNPETIQHVIGRQLIWGLSHMMYEEVQFDENIVTSVDWLTYPVLKMDRVPKSIEIVLINRPDEPPSGAAGMAVGPLPAAIGNAVFDATSVRRRRVPFAPERVKAALNRA